MNLLKSAGFLLKSLYLRPFHSLNVRGDFRIFSNLLVSFHAFMGNFGKIIGKREIFTNEILTQKVHTVKSTRAERKLSFHLSIAHFCAKNKILFFKKKRKPPAETGGKNSYVVVITSNPCTR